STLSSSLGGKPQQFLIASSSGSGRARRGWRRSAAAGAATPRWRRPAVSRLRSSAWLVTPGAVEHRVDRPVAPLIEVEVAVGSAMKLAVDAELRDGLAEGAVGLRVPVADEVEVRDLRHGLGEDEVEGRDQVAQLLRLVFRHAGVHWPALPIRGRCWCNRASSASRRELLVQCRQGGGPTRTTAT